MSNKDGHMTMHFGPAKPKKKYTYEEALAKQYELSQLYKKSDFVIYSCVRCGSVHIGTRIKRPVSGTGLGIYRLFGDMVAARLRGRVTPSLKEMMARRQKDLHPSGD